MAVTSKPKTIPSGTENLLDSVAGQVVKEQGEEEHEQDEQDGLDDDPLVVVPDDELERLDRVQEPDKGGIWAPGSRTVHAYCTYFMCGECKRIPHWQACMC